MRGGDGVERPLTELAETEVETGYSEIDRLEQMRAITVTADVTKTGNSRDVTELLDDHLQLVINGKKRIKNIEELRDLEAEEAKQGDPLAANAWRKWSRRLTPDMILIPWTLPLNISASARVSNFKNMTPLLVHCIPDDFSSLGMLMPTILLCRIFQR